ncbi:MAG: hypothetical protein KKD17_04275 [Nanoarchaeota archaeon]|nr:hypothetical protein [Nanoarchaeota archaeon]
MKRRAIQLAKNTIVVSLPAKWVQQNSIVKGTELDIDVKERMLIVRKDAAAVASSLKASVDISGMSSSLVWNYLNALYRAGFTEISISFSSMSIQDIKSGHSKKTMDVISRVTDKLIGMEIIMQSKNSCVLKEVTQLKGDEYSNVVNRIFLSIATTSKDTLSALREHDKETLENIYMYSEVNINKLSDYCMRILNIQGLDDFRGSNTNYLITFLLEEVGDRYAMIAKAGAADSKEDINRQALDLLERTNSLVSLAHRFFLNPKKEHYVSFHDARNRLKKEADALSLSKAKVDRELLFLIKSVLDKLMEVCNCQVTLTGFV